jgi:PAS domain S-box-containing protein
VSLSAAAPDSRNEPGLRALLEAMCTFVWTEDPSAGVTTPQPGIEKYTGFAFEQYRGKGWVEYVHPDDRDHVTEVWNRAVQSKSWYEVHWRCWNAGTKTWRRCITRGIPVLNADGSVREWVGAVTDIENRIETAYGRQPEWLYMALAAAGMALWEWVPETGEMHWTPHSEQIYGVPPGATRDELDARIHPEDLPKIRAERAKGAATGRVDITDRIIHPSGEIRWLRHKGAAVPGSVPMKLAGVTMDITHMTELQASYRAQAAELQALLDAIPALVMIARDPECLQITGNPAADKWFGCPSGTNYSFTPGPSSSPLPLTPLDVNGMPLAPGDLPMQRACRTGNAVWNEEIEFRLPDKSSRTLLVNAIPLLDAGALRGCLAVCMDVTEAKHAQREIARANRELLFANQQLTEFNYAASHDLREPLRQIAVYSELLAEKLGPRLDEESARCLEVCRSGVYRMQELLDGLQKYAQLTNDPETQNFAAESREAFETARENLASAIAQSHASIEAGELPKVAAAYHSLVQVFQNLLSNAIKYRSSADPVIRVTASRDGDFWRFAVTDNGIGIEPQFHKTIFGMFKRLHSRTHYEGAGMGLAICQRIIERQGGKIWVESQKDQGSTFFFTLHSRD